MKKCKIDDSSICFELAVSSVWQNNVFSSISATEALKYTFLILLFFTVDTYNTALSCAFELLPHYDSLIYNSLRDKFQLIKR